MDSAEGIEQRTDYLTSRILMVTFGATHTTTMVATLMNQADLRRFYMPCIILFPIPNILHLFVRRSSHLSQLMAGKNPQSQRCVNLTLFSKNPSVCIHSVHVYTPNLILNNLHSRIYPFCRETTVHFLKRSDTPCRDDCFRSHRAC
jgi:hypothetical protein